MLFLSLLALVAGPAPSDPPPAKPYYLQSAASVLTAALPPAPQPDSAIAYSDRAVFVSTRGLKGSSRWAAAIADVDMSPEAMMRDFEAAVGHDLAPSTHPALFHLLEHARSDIGNAVDAARPSYRRLRPYQTDPGETCQPPAQLTGLSDYPSGHSTWGFAVALILAELAPNRSGEIIARGRGYGDSRVICGMHNASTIEASRIGAGALIAAMHGSSRFRSDLDQARAELTRR